MYTTDSDVGGMKQNSGSGMKASASRSLNCSKLCCISDESAAITCLSKRSLPQMDACNSYQSTLFGSPSACKNSPVVVCQ